MDGMFEEGMEDFVLYEKDVQGKKSRHQKREQKLIKLKKDMEDPEQKKQRHNVRRQQQKAKLKKQLEGMNEEEARKYLDAKKQNKKMNKERAMKGLESGIPILIDMVYENKMNAKQNKSLAMQIQLIMKAVKHMEDPPGIHLCNVGGVVEEQLQKMNYHYWTLKSNKDDILDVAKSLNKKPVYLSPDAPDQLTQIDPDAAYIIGGLVDRTVLKNASYHRAYQLGIPAVSLPIRQFMKNRACLNLDHVVMMINKFKQTKDWKTAFEYGAPKRWKKETVSQKNKEQQSEQQKKQYQTAKQEKAKIVQTKNEQIK